MSNKSLVLNMVAGQFADKAFHAREVTDRIEKKVHISIARSVLGAMVKEGGLSVRGEGGHRKYSTTDKFVTVLATMLAEKESDTITKEQVQELLVANDDNKAAVMKILDIGREKLNRILAKE